MSYRSKSSRERGNKAQNTILRAGCSYSLKRAVQLLSCYGSASVCQAVLLERIHSLSFQRRASAEVTDSALRPQSGPAAEGSTSCAGCLRLGQGFAQAGGKGVAVVVFPFASTNSWLHTVTVRQPAQNAKVLKLKPRSNPQPFTARIRDSSRIMVIYRELCG